MNPSCEAVPTEVFQQRRSRDCMIEDESIRPPAFHQTLQIIKEVSIHTTHHIENSGSFHFLYPIPSRHFIVPISHFIFNLYSTAMHFSHAVVIAFIAATASASYEYPRYARDSLNVCSNSPLLDCGFTTINPVQTTLPDQCSNTGTLRLSRGRLSIFGSPRLRSLSTCESCQTWNINIPKTQGQG